MRVTEKLIGAPTPKEVKDNVRCIEERLDQGLLTEVQEILAPIQNNCWPSGVTRMNKRNRRAV